MSQDKERPEPDPEREPETLPDSGENADAAAEAGTPDETELQEPRGDAASESGAADGPSEAAGDASPETSGEPAPETPPLDAPETLYEPPTSASFSSEVRKRGGLVPAVFFLIFVMLAAAGYFVYLEQQKFQKSVLTRLTTLESQVSAIQASRDLSESNRQQLESLGRQLASLKSQTVQTLESHRNSLSTLDEDILRLKETVTALKNSIPAAGPVPGSSSGEDADVAIAPRESADTDSGESPSFVPPASPRSKPQDIAPERSEDAEEYIEFVESTTERFFRLVKEGFVNLWRWFASLFQR